jgi:hypothetical protein
LLAEQLPIVAGDCILGEQYVARAERKVAVVCREFQRAAQRDDELSRGVRMPSKFWVRVGLLE